MAALFTIILLTCRARNLLSGSDSLDGDRRRDGSSSVDKTSGIRWWWTRPGRQPQNRYAKRGPFYHPRPYQNHHYQHPSPGSSLTGVRFPISSPAMSAYQQHAHTQASTRGHPGSSHRRPSLGSSTFAIPAGIDDGATPLLIGPMTEGMKRGSQSSAAPTLTDYIDRDDSSLAANSRIVLCPTAGGDAIPVMMMMSPQLHYPGNGSAVGSRTGPLPQRNSPASSVILYGPGRLSGAGTPTNHGSSSYIGYSVDPPGTGCLPQRHMYGGSHMAFYPPGYPVYHHQQQQQQPQQPHPQFMQLMNMRPGSVAGSDKLSLGSGSDRFSAHSSNQFLVQPAVAPQPPSTFYPTQNSYQQQQQHSHRYHEMPAHNHSSSQTDLKDGGQQFDETFGPGNTDTLRPSEFSHPQGEEIDPGTPRPVECSRPRPLPVMLQHMQSSAPNSPGEW